MTGTDRRPAPATIHRRPYRVRFDESGPDGLLRTSGLLRYAQDVAWVHSEAVGFDRAWYRRRGLAWLVRAAELEVVAPIPMGIDVEVTTQVVGHRRVWARRRAEIRLPDGSLGAWVHTDWLMTDERGSIVRIPPDFGRVMPAAPADGPIARVDPGPAPPDALVSTIRVRQQDLDPNDHPNNAVYVDWFEEALLDVDSDAGRRAVRAVPRRYRLEYAAAPRHGALLRATTWPAGTAWFQRLAEDGGREIVRARLDA